MQGGGVLARDEPHLNSLGESTACFHLVCFRFTGTTSERQIQMFSSRKNARWSGTVDFKLVQLSSPLSVRVKSWRVERTFSSPVSGCKDNRLMAWSAKHNRKFHVENDFTVSWHYCWSVHGAGGTADNSVGSIQKKVVYFVLVWFLLGLLDAKESETRLSVTVLLFPFSK